MTKTTAITKTNIDSIHDDIRKALNDVAKKHGLSYKQDGMLRYNASSATMKFSLAVVSESGIPETRELQALKHLMPNLVGANVTVGRMTGKITGFKTRAPKRPFIVTTATGKQYICEVPQIKRAVSKKLAKEIHDAIEAPGAW